MNVLKTGANSMKKVCCLLSVVSLVLILSACALEKSGYIPPQQHPVDAEMPTDRPPVCTDCHEPRDENFDWAQLNHTIYFGENHRQQAYRNEAICSMCHTRNFCSDCHATTVELKASEHNPTETYRRMPHRGDYLSRHRIDGRVDPSSCFRCHGNPKTAANCARCHN